jgi:hypothetical protein
LSFVRFNPNVKTLDETRQALERIYRALDQTQVAKNNFAATRNPINGVGGDDAGDGYSAGSIWINVTLNRVYILEDATVGAASWILLAPEGGSAPLTATFITQTPSAELPNEQALSTLVNQPGILKSNAGVVSIAAAGTDFPALGHTHPLTEITDDGKLAYVDTVEFLTPFFVSATPVAIL